MTFKNHASSGDFRIFFAAHWRGERLYAALAGAACALYGLVLLVNISAPWFSQYNAGDGALFSAIAHNYLDYGVWNLRFGQVVNVAPSAPSEFIYYQNHPPLLPLMVASSFALFGESEAAARLVPIACAIGSIALLVLIARRIYGGRFAVLAALFFATTPTALYFSRKVGYEAITQFFILLAVWAYLQFLKGGGFKRLMLLFLAIAACLFADWPGFLLIPPLVLHHWLTRRRDRYALLLCTGLPVLAIGVFALLVYMSYMVDPESVRFLVGKGLIYSGLAPANSEWTAEIVSAVKQDFSLLDLAEKLIPRLSLLFSFPIFLFAAFGVRVAYRWRDPVKWAPFLLLAVALLYCVIFYKSLYIHLWGTYYLAAPVALFAAAGADVLFGEEEASKSFIGDWTRWRRGVLIFLSLMLVTDAGVRLLTLGESTIHLLPGEQYEQPAFIRDVAAQVRSHSGPGDAILTNLPWMGALQILPYYAKREVVCEIVSVDVLEQWIADNPGRPWRFLYWSEPRGDGWELTEPVLKRLEQEANAPGKDLVVDYQRFFWFDFPERPREKAPE